MSKVSPRRFILLVLALSCAAAFAAVASADHSWGNYHWARTSNPLNLKLGDNLSNVWDPYLRTTSSDWNRSTVLETTIVAGQSSSKTCKGVAGRVEVCNSTYGNNGWLGIAQIRVSGSHITQAVTKLNDTYFNTARYNTSAWRNFVMCQEVGHAFGLDHQDENFSNTNLGSCMDYTNDPAGTTQGANNEHPNSHDYAQLESIYRHLDGTNTAFAPVPEAMNQIDFDSPGQWGRVIKGSKESGQTVHELDFGNGHKIFTFVIWTLEARGRGNDDH